MRESHKSKRVSWASDVSLCQVRLFLSEDTPAQVGLDSQDHLQAKASWLSHQAGTVSSDDVLPPGFEAAQPPSHSQTKLSQVDVVKWKCPSRFALDLKWQVVSGEESEEAGIQNQREMRVLEAIYPRPSAIPPNPLLTPITEDTSRGEANTPSIPITPIEDEDATTDAYSDSAPPSSSLLRVNPSSTDNPAEPTLLAAALTGIVTGNEQGNLIDRDLLLKILSNPNMVEKLVTGYGTPNTNNPPPPPPAATVAPASSGPMYPHQNGAAMGQHPSSRFAAPAKDANYYKSLILQHGEERQEAGLPHYGNRYSHQPPANQEPANGLKPRESKVRVMRPCIYFNSSRGCRHGANCTYQHDSGPFQQRGGSVPEAAAAKRAKFDREISS